jgi:hypothetical protein
MPHVRPLYGIGKAESETAKIIGSHSANLLLLHLNVLKRPRRAYNPPFIATKTVTPGYNGAPISKLSRELALQMRTVFAGVEN